MFPFLDAELGNEVNKETASFMDVDIRDKENVKMHRDDIVNEWGYGQLDRPESM